MKHQLEYTLRKCTIDDYDLLFELKVKCFKWYIEILYGWEENEQRGFLNREVEKLLEHMNIIQVNGCDVGVFTSHLDDNYDCFIEMFAILPEYQKQGIGTDILNKKLKENKQKGIRTYLKAYKGNPATRLYQRVGFEVCEESENHCFMQVCT